MKSDKNAESALSRLAPDYEECFRAYLLKGRDDVRTCWLFRNGEIIEIVDNKEKLPLDSYETAAFLLAFNQLNDHYSLYSPLKSFSDRIDTLNFFEDNATTYTYNFFRETILPEHNKVMANIINNPEKVYLLLQLYRKYKSSHLQREVQSDITFGMIMMFLLNMGIRPYMLEPEKGKRNKMLQEGHDWVYELSGLFGNFEDDLQYSMGGFGDTYETIKDQTMKLRDKKIQKVQNLRYLTAIAMESIIIEQEDGKEVGKKVSSYLAALSQQAHQIVGEAESAFARIEADMLLKKVR